MNGFLILLCMIGLAFYVVHTNSSGPDALRFSAQNAAISAPSPLKHTEAFPQTELHPIAPVAAQSPHAISPDEAPRPTEGTPAVPPQQTEPTEIKGAQPQPAQDFSNQRGFNPQRGEQLSVGSETSIRSGPSSSAEVLGTAHTGAKLRVKSREGDWVQFVDPAANKVGWISLVDVAPLDRGIADRSTVGTAPNQPPKVAKLSSKPIPKVKQPYPMPKAKLSSDYAQLPTDREFLPPSRRGLFGLFWKRRFSGDDSSPH